MKLFSVKDAFLNRAANSQGRWNESNVSHSAQVSDFNFASARVWQSGICSIPLRPRFKFPATSDFFTIGSCFARNVEKLLVSRGVNVLSSTKVETGWIKSTVKDPNGFLNKFTSSSILSEIEFAAGVRASADSIYPGQTPSQIELRY